MNCIGTPRGLERLTGVIEIDWSVGLLTEKLVCPETSLKLAVIVRVPWATGVTRPLAAATVATAVFDELHPT